MAMMMCRGCGRFVTALPDDGGLVPTTKRCRKCDGTVFEDVDADRIVDTSEE